MVHKEGLIVVGIGLILSVIIGGGIGYPLFLKAVTMGLYSKKVMDAFNPPFNKLNGRKAGSNNSTTASLGYPMPCYDLHIQ